ncbi:MAG: hypothetical protein J6Y48_02420, partial [Clostridia bacterium]|nr:hypothetical protein [Clostridia bacterium]
MATTTKKNTTTASQLVNIPNNPPTMDEYKKTGFYGSTNIPAFQEMLASYNRSDAQIRKDAEAMYLPALEQQRTAINNQINELGVSRDREIQQLNNQYNRTLNNVMADLNSRHMGRSSLVATRGVETENARNSAISDVSYNYLQQANQLNANLQQAESEYAQNVENKAVELREQDRNQRLNTLAQIAQLQQSGYSSYVNYLQNKTAQEIQAQQTD